MATDNVLEIKNLHTYFYTDGGVIKAVDGVDVELRRGATLGIVGESGSGKSVTSLSVMGLLAGTKGKIADGEILLDGDDIVKLTKEQQRKLRGSKISMIFQEPMTSLNPVMKIGDQVAECVLQHEKISKKEALKKAEDMLRKTGVPRVEHMMKEYPFQLSGGQRQRVMIAMALVCKPEILIADEPTTALDCVVQAQILELLRNIHRTKGTSILFISHDLNVVRALCSRVIVVYKGEIVEEGQTEDVLLHPKHEYTRHLVASIPEGEKGESSGGEILRLTDLNVFYDVRGGLFRKKGKKHVIHDLNLSAREGEIVGIVGESGCGKSTLSKTILGLHDNYTGEVKVRDGVRPQMVFQDPYSSLNPSQTVRSILKKPLQIHKMVPKDQLDQKVEELAETVGLEKYVLDKFPHELDGGKRQMVGIARALSLNPEFIVCDEPVSALDVSVRAQVLNLIQELKKKKHLTYMFISHDLSVVKYISDRIAVMYLGRIVEIAEKNELYNNPQHPYTKALLSAIPIPDVDNKMKREILTGDVPSPLNPPSGCYFHTRCKYATERCKTECPALHDVGNGHMVACHLT